MERNPLSVCMLLFPDMTQLDFTGPFEVFARMPDTQIHLVSKDDQAVFSSPGKLALQPTMTIREAHTLQFDVIMVPGGSGVAALMEDSETLDFLRDQAVTATYITAVCTGALVLGAAGLLKDYQATTHWLSLDFLELFGAAPVKKRVVIDRNRVTGGGVTAGIDFALTLAGELFGEQEAKRIQLAMEYDPAPPFRSGSPDVADQALVEATRKAAFNMQATRRRIVERAAAALEKL